MKAPRLLIFTKPLVAGRVKTRLIPVLGAGGARDLYARLLRHTLREAASLSGVEVQLWATDPGHPSLGGLAEEFGIGLFGQRGEDLGARMAHALSGGGRSLLIGCDCPGVRREYLRDGLERLRDYPVVLGPALDGGYWAIGSRFDPHPDLFKVIPWGGPQVLCRTRARLEGLGLSWWELPALADLDRPGDLGLLAGWEGGIGVPQ